MSKKNGMIKSIYIIQLFNFRDIKTIIERF